ncbi:hypothetical protein G3O06_02730 [Burkholderia sp. Ac-20345]|uniref:hypothetical protein n=1 Tax=Burkholderia sp. Ac-20345 TaxID=2703891 RepID=UPI00197C9859|nr:hypothetical protein [Burkholderia sp. Ac-20345]
MRKLVAEKRDVAAGEVRAEGWGWVETRIERDCLELNRYGRLRPVQRPYAEDEQHDTDALAAQQDELAEKIEALSEDDDNAYEEADAFAASICLTVRAPMIAHL